MKTLLVAFAGLILTQSAFAQGLIFGSISEKPVVLQLERITPWSGDAELRHIQSNPATMIKTLFVGQEMVEFNKKVLQSKVGKIYCDGEFELANDLHGVQYLSVHSINVCLDEEGFVVAHSFGRPALTPEEIFQSARKIEKNRDAKPKYGTIYQSRSPKHIDLPAGTVSKSDNVKIDSAK